MFEGLSYHENMHLLQSDESVSNNAIGNISERMQDTPWVSDDDLAYSLSI